MFPDFTPKFAAALTALVNVGGDTEAEFTLAILQNYHGETSTHVVLKEIVSRFSGDDEKMSRVRGSLYSTGVVAGELGIAEAWRAKKSALTEWLSDERLTVRAFAAKHIAKLDLMIASEQRHVETEKELRDRDYDGKDDTDNSTGNSDAGG